MFAKIGIFVDRFAVLDSELFQIALKHCHLLLHGFHRRCAQVVADLFERLVLRVRFLKASKARSAPQMSPMIWLKKKKRTSQ
jgi:hypothetical protein